jgi:hypothetical protein
VPEGCRLAAAGTRPDPPEQAAPNSDQVATEHHHDPDCRGNHRGNRHHGFRAKISEEHSEKPRVESRGQIPVDRSALRTNSLPSQGETTISIPRPMMAWHYLNNRDAKTASLSTAKVQPPFARGPMTTSRIEPLRCQRPTGHSAEGSSHLFQRRLHGRVAGEVLSLSGLVAGAEQLLPYLPFPPDINPVSQGQCGQWPARPVWPLRWIWSE